MGEPKDCGRCHLAGVPQVMPSGAVVTEDFCGGCPRRDTSDLVIDLPRAATPEEQREFWRRAEQAAAQYASVTVMLPMVQVGTGKRDLVVVFDGD